MKSGNNKKLGSDFEYKFAMALFLKGFWVSQITPNKAGQSSDVSACKNGKPFLIDCKYCQNAVFKLNRIETNQESSMKLFQQRGNGVGWFALGYKESILMVDLTTLLKARDDEKKSQLTLSDVRARGGLFFHEWLSKYVCQDFK